MENKKTAIIKCINEIKFLRRQEEKQLDQILSIINTHPIDIAQDNIPRLFVAPFANCEGCMHCNNGICDIIQYGCHFENEN